MSTRTFALGVILATIVGGAPAGAAEAASWSAPAMLSSCTGDGAPLVIFPSDRPNHATGPGAIVWSAVGNCAGGEGARVAAIGAGDIPAAPIVPATAGGSRIAPQAAISASGAPHGKIVIAGRSPSHPGNTLVIQGAANGSFTALSEIRGDPAPPALSRAYLGDVALASQVSAGAHRNQLSVSVERYFARHLIPRRAVSSWSGAPASAVSVALDYRTDVLTVWAQGGSLWAHNMPASDLLEPIQRLASVQPGVRIAALLSDDNRATVAWEQESAGVSSVYLERSAVGVRFGKPKLLERFRNPDGLADPSGSPRLVRLSSESVMMAWAGAAAGHWAIRAAAVDSGGVGAVTTIAAPGTDALLADLAPGPNDDALLLWSEPQLSATGTPELESQQLLSARGEDIAPGRTVFAAPEPIAGGVGLDNDATVALDPANDRAVAAWRGTEGTFQYSVRNSTSATQ